MPTNHEIALDYIKRVDKLSYNELADALTYKWFRLNNLYQIKDKSTGKAILFTPNAEQEDFYLNQHCRDVILKARQLGFTTFKMIDDLDECLFNADFSAGCICHNLESAKDIFRNKIKFAYQGITDGQRELLAETGYKLPVPVTDTGNAYVFSNGSSIKVGTSYRGNTLQSLHVSEFGSICKKHPDKATEIVTGAFEAVAVGSVITIESTAEGRAGYFYEYATESKRMRDLNKPLSLLDFKFHFYPWYDNKGYAIDGEIPERLRPYFERLAGKYGVHLTDKQKAWYAAKEKSLGEEIKREYPSTPEEAFEQTAHGAYYAQQFTKIYSDGRICEGLNNDAPVNTAWDLGVGDSTVIWFYQRIGNEIHVMDYYENSGEGLQHYAKVLRDKGYTYGTHYAPHDIEHRDFSGKGQTRKDAAAEGYDLDGDGAMYRIYFETVAKLTVDDGIDYSRKILDRCVFDEKKCETGIKSLESYRKEWNDKLGCWRDRPLHDWASHAADAFRYLAVAEEGSKKYCAAPEIKLW